MLRFDPDAAKLASGYWYLGSPYSKYPRGLEEAFREVARVAAAMVKLGIGVFSPIAHTHPLAVHGCIDPLDYDVWLPADRFLMAQAHGLLVVEMEGWRESYGLNHEIEFFKREGKPIMAIGHESYEPLIAPIRAAFARDAGEMRGLRRKKALRPIG